MPRLTAAVAVSLFGWSASLGAQVPIDFRGIPWGVDFDAARKTAAEKKKPLLVVFR